MRTKRKIQVIETIVDKIFCNKCGKITCNDGGVMESGVTLVATFGCGSDKDGMQEMWSLCDQCYDEFISTFLHDPEDLTNGRDC